jgi:hypothetical protein
MSVPSRDPLAQAAAAIKQKEGLATKPCEKCWSAGRELLPPNVYVARSLVGEDMDRCYVVYECPGCGNGESFEIPPHLMLASEIRIDALGRATGDAPGLFYSRADDDTLTFWVDAADGQPPVKLGEGPLTIDGNVARVKTVVDFLAGGSAERERPTDGVQ